MRMTQVSSGLITTHALISGYVLAALCAAADLIANGRWNPSASPPPAAAAEPTMNLRRERLVDGVTFATRSTPAALLIVFFMRRPYALDLRSAGATERPSFTAAAAMCTPARIR